MAVVKYKSQNYRTLRRNHLTFSRKFEDPEFPLEAGPGIDNDGVEWLRPSELAVGPRLLSDGFEFGRQGRAYRVWVDDRLPSRGGQLLRCHSDDGAEFLERSAEKAYAKTGRKTLLNHSLRTHPPSQTPWWPTRSRKRPHLRRHCQLLRGIPDSWDLRHLQAQVDLTNPVAGIGWREFCRASFGVTASCCSACGIKPHATTRWPGSSATLDISEPAPSSGSATGAVCNWSAQPAGGAGNPPTEPHNYGVTVCLEQGGPEAACRPTCWRPWVLELLRAEDNRNTPPAIGCRAAGPRGWCARAMERRAVITLGASLPPGATCCCRSSAMLRSISPSGPSRRSSGPEAFPAKFSSDAGVGLPGPEPQVGVPPGGAAGDGVAAWLKCPPAEVKIKAAVALPNSSISDWYSRYYYAEPEQGDTFETDLRLLIHRYKLGEPVNIDTLLGYFEHSAQPSQSIDCRSGIGRPRAESAQRTEPSKTSGSDSPKPFATLPAGPFLQLQNRLALRGKSVGFSLRLRRGNRGQCGGSCSRHHKLFSGPDASFLYKSSTGPTFLYSQVQDPMTHASVYYSAVGSYTSPRSGQVSIGRVGGATGQEAALIGQDGQPIGVSLALRAVHGGGLGGDLTSRNSSLTRVFI
uniref:Calpain catalytic domain-containing protein n=1 Tax=Macrostomum lignano TaxID=282301 RepID=A0A1I8FKY6_9PLAT